MDTKTQKKKTRAPSAACAVAPEDLRRGDYLAVTHTTYQLVPWPDNAWCSELKPLSIRLMPLDGTETFRVLAVCLPYVLTRVASGGHRTLDLRRHHIRRLDDSFGKQAFRAQRDSKKEKRSGRRRKSRKGKRKRKGK